MADPFQVIRQQLPAVMVAAHADQRKAGIHRTEQRDDLGDVGAPGRLAGRQPLGAVRNRLREPPHLGDPRPASASACFRRSAT